MTQVIEINGRRYDAHTGEHIGEATKLAAPKLTVKIKARKVAKHVQPHATASSKLLMRQAVKKPAAHSKLKVHGPLKTIQPANDLVVIKHVEHRLQHAKQVSRSHKVQHFASLSPRAYSAAVAAPRPLINDVHHIAVRQVAAAHKRAKKPQTTSELLEIALKSATAHEAKPLPLRKRHLFSRRTRAAA